MEGILVVNDSNREWHLNNKKRYENEKPSNHIINYWTNNWMPKKDRIKPGDKIYFGEKSQYYAHGTFVESEKNISIEEVYLKYGEMNGLTKEDSLDDFINMIKKAFSSDNESIDKDYKIGCIIVDNIKYEKGLLKKKPNQSIVYV